MLIPQYWAEGRVQSRTPDRQVTIRRFGWSDVSQADAQALADARANEAMEANLSGVPIVKRERKVPYNGADGLPIREEIVSRHGETIITRNSYGARCLNTPNVLFADVDFDEVPPISISCTVFVVLVIGAGGAGWLAQSVCLGTILAVAAAIGSWALARAMHRVGQRLRGGVEAASLARINKFAEAHSDWNLRVYRTPAGYRVLATHRPFSPREPEVSGFFKAIGGDPLYARMCWNQQCFRARVSPKPWRIGIQKHMRPRPGVWPVRPERFAERQQWIADYEVTAHDFAACAYLDSLGNGVIHSEIRPVLELHDSMCRATSGLPMG